MYLVSIIIIEKIIFDLVTSFADFFDPNMHSVTCVRLRNLRDKKVQVGNDQEMEQSIKSPTPKTELGKN